VMGDDANVKITTPENMNRAEQWLASTYETRVGHGVDVHTFIVDAGSRSLSASRRLSAPHPTPPPRGGGNAIMLCGVSVPCPYAVEAHSDGDVGLHALVDALLGAIGAGDIGEHFPPTDARWKDADSGQFVSHAVQTVKDAGGS